VKTHIDYLSKDEESYLQKLKAIAYFSVNLKAFGRACRTLADMIEIHERIGH
jgi:hypothetical protein